jgi:hypothetical protein
MLDESALEEQADRPIRLRQDGVSRLPQKLCHQGTIPAGKTRLHGAVCCPMFGVMSLGQASTLPPALRPFRAKRICSPTSLLRDNSVTKLPSLRRLTRR